jgi:hypothetical protein
MRITVRPHLVAATFLIACVSTPTVQGAAPDDNLLHQLARVRAATVQYHDVEQALADGYVNIGSTPEEGEGIEFVNFGLVDCTLDAAVPEALRYVQSGQGFRLVAVEYAIPMACASTPPEDFLHGAGEWEPEPGVPVWSLLVPVWSGSSLDNGGGR